MERTVNDLLLRLLNQRGDAQIRVFAGGKYVGLAEVRASDRGDTVVLVADRT